MKKIESYGRVYEYHHQPLNHGHRYAKDNAEDNIAEKLQGICFQIGVNGCHASLSIKAQKFQWFEDNSLYFIKVIQDSRPGDGKYTRKVEIEIMPPTAKLPKELSDLLKEKGFKKIE